MVRSKSIFQFAFAILLSTKPAYAEAPSIIVLAESSDDSDTIKCGIANYASLAATKSALRYNGFSIIENTSGLLGAYLNLEALTIESASDENNVVCAIHVSFEITKAATLRKIFDPATTTFGFQSYCKKDSLLIWHNSTSQDKINQVLRGFVDQCANQIR